MVYAIVSIFGVVISVIGPWDEPNGMHKCREAVYGHIATWENEDFDLAKKNNIKIFCKEYSEPPKEGSKLPE